MVSRNTTFKSLLRVSQVVCCTNFTQKCKYDRYAKGVATELFKRREAQGPEPVCHRSEKPNWNYSSEIHCFGKRLGEEFNIDILRCAFTFRSYIEKEAKDRQKIGLDSFDVSPSDASNSNLVNLGHQIMETYIENYISLQYPNLPKHFVRQICDHLLSQNILAHVSSHLGTKDLILTEDLTTDDTVLADCLKAVIGALSESQSVNRANVFVRDFVIAQLVGRNVFDHLSIENPLTLLTEYLNNKGLATPEPRMIWCAGPESVVAAYAVALYCDKKFFCKGYGETVSIATEMAARKGLQKIFGMTDHQTPLNFNQELHEETNNSQQTMVS